MKVTDYEGENQLLIGLKYTVIVENTGSPILTTPRSMSLFLCGTRVPIQYRGVHTPLYITRQGIFIYLNLFYTEILVVLIPPQNMFKMFPLISGLENIVIVKGWYWHILITIKAILFNLDRWQWIITHHTNSLVNHWQISPVWCEILNSLHHHKALQSHHKSVGQTFSECLMSSQLYVHESPIVR